MVSKHPKAPALFLFGTLGIGGSENKFVALANRLKSSKYPVHVAYLREPETLRTRLKNIPVVHLEQRGKWSIHACRILLRYIRSHQIRTVITVNFYPLCYAIPIALLWRKLDLRVIASINTSILSSPRELALMWLYGFLFRRCDHVVFGSESQRRMWSEQHHIPEKKSTVIYNGVDASVFDPQLVSESRSAIRSRMGITEDAYLIVCVGQLRPEKGHTYLLEAISRVDNLCDRTAHVILVGDGPEKSRIVKFARDLDLSHRIHLVGSVQDVRPYLKMSDLFVLTSVAVETFSNAALEASAMGLPVVMSDIGGAKEMFPDGEYGVVYASKDIDSLVSKLAQKISNGLLSAETSAQVRDDILNRFPLGNMDSGWLTVIWNRCNTPLSDMATNGPEK